MKRGVVRTADKPHSSTTLISGSPLVFICISTFSVGMAFFFCSVQWKLTHLQSTLTHTQIICQWKCCVHSAVITIANFLYFKVVSDSIMYYVYFCCGIPRGLFNETLVIILFIYFQITCWLFRMHLAGSKIISRCSCVYKQISVTTR